MKFLALLALILWQHTDAANQEPQSNPDPTEVQLVVPENHHAGFSVRFNDNGLEGGYESFKKIDKSHNIVITKLAGNHLKVQWGPGNSMTLDFKVGFRLIAGVPQFKSNKGRRSAVVGYLKINGVDEDIRVILTE